MPEHLTKYDFKTYDILTNRNFSQKSSEVSVREQPPAGNESELLSFHEYNQSKIRKDDSK